ncbi:MAG: hypothetical protein HYR74_04110 [Candidatus Eisenbacteria bacterium]|nr:hypothetical protein [Candidatus Eisenbacteria bacterium]
MECAAASPDVAAAPARGITLAAVGAAIPDLALAGAFLATWIAPSPDRVWAINGLMLLMLLEFINVHSSAFMGQTIVSAMPRPQKAAAIVTLGAFYTLFVGAFSLAMRQLWPLVSFWGLTLNRLLGVLIGQAPAGEEALFLRRTWAASVMFYLLGAFVTTLAPLPRLGVSPAIMAHFNRMGTSGLWLDQPWRVLAFGFIYFTAVAVSELFGHRWI